MDINNEYFDKCYLETYSNCNDTLFNSLNNRELNLDILNSAEDFNNRMCTPFLEYNEFKENLVSNTFATNLDFVYNEKIIINNDSQSTHSSVVSKPKDQNSTNICTGSEGKYDLSNYRNKELKLLNSKKGRPIADRDLIIDNDQVYDPDENYEEYKKARKRIQNRDAAIRAREKKKDTKKGLETELEYLKKENCRLVYENEALKSEKGFLLEQVKFMQSLIKSDHNKDAKMNIDSTNNSNLAEIDSNRKMLGFQGKKAFNKFFSVFVITMLGLICVLINFENDVSTNIDLNSGNSITLKDADSVGSKLGSGPAVYTRLLKPFTYCAFIISIFLFVANSSAEYLINFRKKLK